jgi:hypothetical protein
LCSSPFKAGERWKVEKGLNMQQIISELPDLVDVPLAAKYLGVARKVVYQLVDFGELRAIRQGGKIWIDPCSLRDCHDKGKVT